MKKKIKVTLKSQQKLGICQVDGRNRATPISKYEDNVGAGKLIGQCRVGKSIPG